MRKHKLFKRALAAILTLTMALGILPVTVFAEETSQAAANTAAMQALESRVFTIVDEQYTIADLEKATAVMVTASDGELIAVPGNEIRAYLLANDLIQVDGTISVSLETLTQYGQARIKIYATSTHKLIRVEASNIECRDTNGNQYIKCNIQKSNVFPATDITAYSNAFSYPQGTIPIFYYDSIVVTCEGNEKGFFAQKKSPYP